MPQNSASGAIVQETFLPPSRNPMKRLYNWILHWAATPFGVWALFLLAFTESSCFPVPPDVLLIALCMGLPRRWSWFALVCTVGSVVGGLAGYGIGYFFRDSVGQILLEWTGILAIHGDASWADAYLALGSALSEMAKTQAHLGQIAQEIRATGEALAAGSLAELTASQKALWVRGEALRWFNGPFGPWAVAIAGFTPIPYKVFTITAGMFEMNVLKFTIASALSRGARFFAVAAIIGLTYRFFGDRIRVFIDRYFNWLCIGFTILLVGGFAVLKYLR
ncbi:MAG TPA: DedA family protein [Sumerlaeia bacterium]|nr:DedA family protein [Sumerlaeia bacterium]